MRFRSLVLAAALSVGLVSACSPRHAFHAIEVAAAVAEVAIVASILHHHDSHYHGHGCGHRYRYYDGRYNYWYGGHWEYYDAHAGYWYRY